MNNWDVTCIASFFFIMGKLILELCCCDFSVFGNDVMMCVNASECASGYLRPQCLNLSRANTLDSFVTSKFSSVAYVDKM